PVFRDGARAGAAALGAVSIPPTPRQYLFAGHRSVEPGSRAALEHLGLDPLLDLDLRLGEGTGATLSLAVLQASAKLLREMATFDSAGVTEKETHPLAGTPAPRGEPVTPIDQKRSTPVTGSSEWAGRA